MQQPESECLTPPPDLNPRRRRKPLSCEPCRHSKLRCDRQAPCLTCVKRGWQDQCTYEPTPRSESRQSPRRRRTRARQSAATTGPAVAPVSAVPVREEEPQSGNVHKAVIPPAPSSPGLGHRDHSPEAINRRWDQVLRRPPEVERTNARPGPADAISPMICFGPGVPTTELLRMLPPDAVCEYLLCWYFNYLCPLFRVMHGPTFQKHYSAFLKDRESVDLSWLALLFAICSLTVKAIPPTDAGLLELWPQHQASPLDLSLQSQSYRTAAMMSLAQDQFLIRHNLNTLEALLVIIHTITETEGAEYGWTLLGNALHIAIALRCHAADNSEPNCIKRERRRRCWAGIMLLHTDQALLFRDTSLTFLCDMKTPLPADANDIDILEHAITVQPNQTGAAAAPPKPTDMSFMRFHSRLFHLATDVCNAISKPNVLPDEALLIRLDNAVQHEQQRWDALYLVDGDRSVLDATGYAHWCLLQTYAHQLYLLLHRHYHSSRSPRSFRQQSRDRCIASGLALMDIHRQLCELPRLRAYRWMINGSISCNALHGAVALTSCLLDGPRDDANVRAYIDAINETALRIGRLRGSSPACASVYVIMRHLQSRLTRPDIALSAEQDTMEGRFDDWLNNIDWFRPDDIGWDLWDADFITPQTGNDQTVVA